MSRQRCIVIKLNHKPPYLWDILFQDIHWMDDTIGDDSIYMMAWNEVNEILCQKSRLLLICIRRGIMGQNDVN